MARLLIASVLLVSFVAGGCAQTRKSAYYGVWSKLGWAKRDILVDRVEDARDEQNAAKEQFKTTLEKFQEITGSSGGELESKYKKLNSAYEDCVKRAEAVTTQINKVDTVATDLFKEWEAELEQYDNAELKKSSAEKLASTKTRYAQLLSVMRASESKMPPVVKAFHDQVLYLKHNLNAQAIASLQTTATTIEGDVQNLIKDMEASINEANDFLSQLKA